MSVVVNLNKYKKEKQKRLAEKDLQASIDFVNYLNNMDGEDIKNLLNSVCEDDSEG